jgi:hypothetical protein
LIVGALALTVSTIGFAMSSIILLSFKVTATIIINVLFLTSAFAMVTLTGYNLWRSRFLWEIQSENGTKKIREKSIILAVAAFFIAGYMITAIVGLGIESSTYAWPFFSTLYQSLAM